MRKINIAKNAGFCFGVKRAVSMALDGAKEHKDIFMIGDIRSGFSTHQKIIAVVFVTLHNHHTFVVYLL